MCPASAAARRRRWRDLRAFRAVAAAEAAEAVCMVGAVGVWSWMDHGATPSPAPAGWFDGGTDHLPILGEARLHARWPMALAHVRCTPPALAQAPDQAGDLISFLARGSRVEAGPRLS
mmetsp:Transcript_1763/g.5243  ORF Transcript_1763/g.5243 Transcript_1763/m.5243 type:complete len:118 (-) Transcript_1763:64-417(-)